MKAMVPIISVVGKTNSGKTTFIEKLIKELKRRGYRVATVKHDVHNFEIDHEGKDTWRHAQAGADTVVISSKGKLAMIKKLDGQHSLDELSRWLLKDVDIIITEGYKRQDKPKIEIFRKEVGRKLLCSPSELLAVVTDQAVDLDVPSFGLDDAAGVVNLVENIYLSDRKGGRRR